MKPRILKIASSRAWSCHGCGAHAIGFDPMDAYCKWRLKVKPLMIEE